jgi:hypothetical protein
MLIEAYRRIIDWAQSKGKRAVLVVFPHRYEVYFDARTIGLESMSQSQYYTELGLLKESFASASLTVVDTYPAFRKFYLSSHPEGELPYLVQDGHLSVSGHKIVANEVIAALKQVTLNR